jgi:hypothetical protein
LALAGRGSDGSEVSTTEGQGADRQFSAGARTQCRQSRRSLVTPEHERGQLLDFRHRLEQAGFWEGECSRLDYRFLNGDVEHAAIVTPVRLNGLVYALVQKSG